MVTYYGVYMLINIVLLFNLLVSEVGKYAVCTTDYSLQRCIHADMLACPTHNLIAPAASSIRMHENMHVV